MEAILIEPKNEREQEILNNFLKSNGISSLMVSEKIKRYIAGLKMVEIAGKHPKFDISDEEIINMLKEDEDEIYGQENEDNN